MLFWYYSFYIYGIKLYKCHTKVIKMKYYEKNMVCFNNKLPVQILTLIHKYT